MEIKLAVVIAILVTAFIGSFVLGFMKSSRETKIANIKEWLKYAVTLAEKDLGSGTGQLKLRQVYNMAVSQFPWIVHFVSFEKFSVWVDEALEWMNKQLSENKAVQSFLEK